LVHATSLRKLWLRLGAFGLATIDHAVPFHRSTSVIASEDGEDRTAAPTAKQLVAETHDTSFSEFSPCLLGLVTIDHAVPFHRSAKVRVPNPPLSVVPTAMQNVALRQATLSNALSKPRLGLTTRDHALPVQCSIYGWPTDVPSTW